MKKIIIIFVFIFVFVSPAFGLKKYGDATIKKGHMTVLRGGQNLKFSDSGRTYVIFNNDVLKVGYDSMVILKTVEDAIVQIGSNAVFQVRPWKQKKKHGYLRMLYGKAIFKVRKFFIKKKRFNFKTATAVAGVRGTKWKEQTTSTGAGETEGIEEIVVITPAGLYIDLEIHVKPGERSLTLNTVKITRPIKVPVEERVREEEPEIVLTSLPPTSKESVKIENKEFYIINNIVTVDEFKESESETVDINENFDKLEEPPPEAKEEVEEEPDEDFEGDFEESEDVPEIELQAALPLVSIEVGKPIESEKIPEIELDLDTEEIIEDLTNTVNEAATESLDKKGNLSIEFEK